MLYHALRYLALWAAIYAILLPQTREVSADEFGIRDVSAAPVSPDHYLLRLQDSFDGNIWPVDMHIEYGDGRFGRTWVVGLWPLMGGDQPRLELEPSRLTVDDKGLRGVAKVNLINEPKHAQNSLEFVLDVQRQGEQLTGRWERRFGEAGMQETVAGKITGDSNTLGRLALKLNGLLHGNPAGGDYVWLTFARDEKGNLVDAWAEAKRVFNSRRHTVRWCGLDFGNDVLQGEVEITLLPDGNVPEDCRAIHCIVELDAKIVDGLVTGSFTGQWNAPLTWSGAITGRVQGEQAWRSENGVATGGDDWPKWLGPYDNGVAQRYGQKLVESLKDARLVWKSEDTPGGRSKGKQLGHGFDDSGASSPIVKDGRVYLFYQVPHGGEYDKSQEARARAAGVTGYNTKSWSILSDEVLLCVDAATGRTLWKTVFPGKGLYWLPEQHVVANLTPCVFNGRVYAVGTTGRVYCADAVTGRKLWESDLGAKHDALKAYAAQCLIDRRFGIRPSMPRVSTPTFSARDDVFITTDFDIAPDVWRANHGLVGFEGKSGRVLWRIDGALGLWASPIRWSYDGQEYVIAGNVKGELRCIDPASGEVVWQLDGVGQFWNEPTVIGDFLLAPIGGLRWNGSDAPDGGYARESGCRVGCYRLNARGAERIWMLSSRYDFPGFDNLCGREGYVFSRMDGRQVCIELATGEVVATVDDDPLMEARPEFRVDRSGCGINELWEDRWVYAPNFTRDEADGDAPALAARRFHMFRADPQDFEWLDATLLPHKRFSTSECRGLAWPYVDGRVFIRGGDGIYCYDLRAPDSE